MDGRGVTEKEESGSDGVGALTGQVEAREVGEVARRGAAGGSCIAVFLRQRFERTSCMAGLGALQFSSDLQGASQDFIVCRAPSLQAVKGI